MIKFNWRKEECRGWTEFIATHSGIKVLIIKRPYPECTSLYMNGEDDEEVCHSFKEAVVIASAMINSILARRERELNEELEEFALAALASF